MMRAPQARHRGDEWEPEDEADGDAPGASPPDDDDVDDGSGGVLPTTEEVVGGAAAAAPPPDDAPPPPPLPELTPEVAERVQMLDTLAHDVLSKARRAAFRRELCLSR